MFYILFSMLLLLISNQTAMAENGYVEPFQGIINSTEGSPGYIFVNERMILLDKGIVIKDHEEKEAAISDLRNGQWVYIVSEERAAGPTALRIYLLPGHIRDNEKRNYPFIIREEEPEE